ncbi:ATP-binding protein [Pontibacter virosus]|uniref:ATP-dependent DNA helicase recG-like protein n=1 Tax=Pontibacter virosus TaxID=1765052 RepID=A0A2U1B4S3_9BACT|nr:ATP-binding protein [Pontibacter virosus]PVY43679.1 ATP-dependent DNA helicase recG-like protein [Pontibacter virosus]
MVNLTPASPGNILSLFHEPVKPVFLLGAGASKTSGIPLAGEVTEKIIRTAYCRDQGYPTNYPMVQRSDWVPWVKEFPWYNTSVSATENYPIVVDELLRPQSVRREFFLELVNPSGISPSIGYDALAEMLQNKLVDIVLTTNFDNCLGNAMTYKKQILIPIKTNNDYVQFSLTPKFPLEIYLHGSVEHYSDKNIVEEVQSLSADTVEKMQPLLRDHPLVVVGYRGGEPSITKSLLIDSLEYTNNFKNGIWWCLLKQEKPENCPPLVLELAEKCGGNFRFVHIDGFDQLLYKDLWQRLKPSLNRIALKPTLITHNSSGNSSPTFDTQPVVKATEEELEWSLIQERIIEYSNRLDIYLPSSLGKERLRQEMLNRHLAVYQEGVFKLTSAGCLLYTSLPQYHFPDAVVLFSLTGPDGWKREISAKLLDDDDSEVQNFQRMIKGNLWRQLNEVMDSLALINRAYRLKGESSETVYPYPPLAIKEIIVNALVHRDYSKSGKVEIEVTPHYIKVISPGGLTEEVKLQVASNSIEDEIVKNGRRGIKGYRNPILADIFYGSGAMDKAGSGLSDVYRWMNENESTVTFGPSQDNETFEVTLYGRQDIVDSLTKTASPLKTTTVKYAANILELVNIPQQIWSASSTCSSKKEIWKALSDKWHPQFVYYGGRVWTFFDLNQRNSPLKSVIDFGTVEVYDLEDFISIENGKLFTQLVNLNIEEHFSSLGLRIDKKRHRAYFPRLKEEGSRTQSYQARFKKATRTVAKPRTSLSTGKILYWEHQAISYKFEKFGHSYGLFINPSYVFTIEGWKKLLASDKVNKLSTKKAARDYNMTVLNALIFWSRFIAGNEDSYSFELKPNIRRFGDDSSRYSLPRLGFSAILPVTSINDVSIEGHDFIEPEENSNLLEAVDQELENLLKEFLDTDDNL